MEKNADYWQAGKPEIQNVRYIALATADAASASLIAGQVDWMSAFLPGLDQLLKNQKNLTYVNTPALTASIFTCAGADYGCKGPQTDPAVRQAIYYALNRDQLNKLAGGGFAQTASPTMLLPERDKDWIADQAEHDHAGRPGRGQGQPDPGRGRLGQGRRRHPQQGRPAGVDDDPDGDRLERLHLAQRRHDPGAQGGRHRAEADPAGLAASGTTTRSRASSSCRWTRSGWAPRPTRTSPTSRSTRSATTARWARRPD